MVGAFTGDDDLLGCDRYCYIVTVSGIGGNRQWAMGNSKIYTSDKQRSLLAKGFHKCKLQLV
ncbi:MAG: hypothetical protein RMY28_020605 [Nostoc sp. ChiSLP01]|nr:hypothetical protein [Nostoc sp. CmiSLP01]MDZ8288304.1 hypothetical protein [Nostoc sp. ChiSLP01]